MKSAVMHKDAWRWLSVHCANMTAYRKGGWVPHLDDDLTHRSLAKSVGGFSPHQVFAGFKPICLEASSEGASKTGIPEDGNLLAVRIRNDRIKRDGLIYIHVH